MIKKAGRVRNLGKLFFFALTACVLCAPNVRADELLVFAAASLTDVLKEIASDYQAHQPARNDKVQFNFAGSNVLARQILAGAPADVFFSADEAQMDLLEKAGLLLPGTRQSLLSNTLVVVVGAGSAIPLPMESARDLTEAGISRIALADTRAVPAGIYAKEYLEKAGVWKAVKDRVIPTMNVRTALAVVASGDVDAGIIYKTDAATSQKVKIAYEVPRREGPGISYPVAALKASHHVAEVRAFLEYLKSEAAAAIFRKYGFIVRS